jgi:hypothetical protein
MHPIDGILPVRSRIGDALLLVDEEVVPLAAACDELGQAGRL